MQKCTKKRDARAKLLFCLSKPIAFLPGRSRWRRRRRCLSSLSRISETPRIYRGVEGISDTILVREYFSTFMIRVKAKDRPSSFGTFHWWKNGKSFEVIRKLKVLVKKEKSWWRLSVSSLNSWRRRAWLSKSGGKFKSLFSSLFCSESSYVLDLDVFVLIISVSS